MRLPRRAALRLPRATPPIRTPFPTDRAALKSAFRAAALRWHPDKFAQTFAARLARAPAAERAETERRVAETFRDVRRAYERALREAA